MNCLIKYMLHVRNVFSKLLSIKDAGPILIELLDGQKKMTELKNVIANYDTLRNLVRELQQMKLLRTKEVVKERRIIYVSLTEEGRVVARKLDMFISNEFLGPKQQKQIEELISKTGKWKTILDFVVDAVEEKIGSVQL